MTAPARACDGSASDEQYRLIAKHRMAEMRDMDAYIAVRGSHNIAEWSDVPTAKMDLAQSHTRKVLRLPGREDALVCPALAARRRWRSRPG